jgi:hypothetical protein
VNAILIDRMQRGLNKFGITKVESNPELETNTRVLDQWKHFERRQHKRRRCFIKHLEIDEAPVENPIEFSTTSQRDPFGR